jgi:DNA-binding ferritin-like protein
MKKRKSLKESLYDYKEYEFSIKEYLKDGLKYYETEEYGLLGVMLAFTEALSMIHQSHHWQKQGDSFFGDHLMYQRLYEETNAEIDVLAEKIVGVGGIKMTNYFTRLSIIRSFMRGVAKGEAPEVESHRAGLMYVIAGEMVMDVLKEKDILTRGIEQALGNILDKHESHIYLLQNRNNAAINQ